MNVKPGTYNLGPSDGTVQVKTGREVTDAVEIHLDVILPTESG